MCVILIKPSGVNLPDNFEQYFRRGVISNNDGSGIAIHKKGSNYINFRKNLDNEEIVKTFINSMRTLSEKEKTDCTIMFHARMRTAGVVSHFNCHPFVLQPNSFIHKKNRGIMTNDFSYHPVMMHNGGFYEYTGDITYSDTYIFSEKVLSQLSIDELLKLHKTDKIGGGKVAVLLPIDNNNLVLSGTFMKDENTSLLMSNTACMTRDYKMAQDALWQNTFD